MTTRARRLAADTLGTPSGDTASAAQGVLSQPAARPVLVKPAGRPLTQGAVGTGTPLGQRMGSRLQQADAEGKAKSRDKAKPKAAAQGE